MPNGQVSVWVPILEDRLAWREKRLAIAVDFLITLNAWRELAVDSWREARRDGQAADATVSRLHDAVTRMSDQLAEIKLVGTERMRTAAADAVDALLETSTAARESLDGFETASLRLSAVIHGLRETFRAELGIPDGR
ncbi:hypothetical protein AB0J40_18135 [Amycolatopsis sp. NPDC049691]|uniref:hypothetical protein n=1 Tax=Amycolatopsis sp. NPDC049691 TaxID=3155155 RepID=UPI003421EA91